MTIAEMVVLDEEHPEWVDMTNDEISRRFWMYDVQTVRLARAAVHWRRLLAMLAWPAGWIAGNFS